MNVEIEKAKIDSVTSEVDNDKGDSSRSWKAIDMLFGRKSKVFGVNDMTVDQSVITCPNSIANASNEHFSTIGSKSVQVYKMALNLQRHMSNQVNLNLNFQ